MYGKSLICQTERLLLLPRDASGRNSQRIPRGNAVKSNGFKESADVFIGLGKQADALPNQ